MTEIPVTTRKCTKTYTETITPGDQEEVPRIVQNLLPRAKKQRANGRIVINLSQGGVRNLTWEKIEEVDKK